MLCLLTDSDLSLCSTLPVAFSAAPTDAYCARVTPALRLPAAPAAAASAVSGAWLRRAAALYVPGYAVLIGGVAALVRDVCAARVAAGEAVTLAVNVGGRPVLTPPHLEVE